MSAFDLADGNLLTLCQRKDFRSDASVCFDGRMPLADLCAKYGVGESYARRAFRLLYGAEVAS